MRRGLQGLRGVIELGTTGASQGGAAGARSSLVGGLLVVMSCSAGDAPPPSVTTWNVEEEPSIEIASSEEDREQLIYGVLGVEHLSNGGVALANAGSESILLFDSLGVFVREMGGPGGGPGEFWGLIDIDPCGGDTIAAWSLDRISYFSLDGAFVRSRPRSRPSDGAIRDVAGVSSDCSGVLVVDRYPQPPTAESWPHAIRWLQSDLDAVTLREFAGRPMAAVEVAGRPTSMRVPFGAVPTWATDGGLVFLGLARDPEILVYDRGGRDAQVIRWEGAPDPVTDADRRLGARRYQESLGEEAAVMPDWEDFPLPERKPVYGRLVLAEEGDLWVQDYPSTAGGFPLLHTPRVGGEPQRWRVFSREGELQSSVTMPSGLDLRAVSGDFVFGVFRDELDVEVIRVHRLRR